MAPLPEAVGSDDVTCPSCGSKLGLVAAQTQDWSTSGGDSAEVPRRIGHFELLQRLGAGAFGTVWKARDTHLDRIVAVKMPHRGRLGPAETEKVLREARAAGQLRHSNIVSVHEVGLDGGQLYIVSDFIEGLPLDQWLEGQKPGHREAAALVQKIALALDHAHQQGVIHRDLKPSNIMVDRAGEPHVTDFGLAKREAGEVTMTLEGQILGTPAYMSPEQAKGQAHAADRRTDVYSLGVILFELLTGERPFRGNVRMLLKQVVEDDPPSPRKFDSHVPRDLETICLKCLQKDPARRYGSARALADELDRYLRGLPIQARPVGALERFARWCRRNPRVAAAAVVAVAGLLFGLVAGWIAYVRVSWALAQTYQAQRRADAFFLRQRRIVDDLFTRVSEDTLLNQPGMQPLRRDLLRRARDYYEEFLVQSGGNQAIEDELALAHFRVGVISEEIESAGKALPCYAEARHIQARLAAADPQNADRLKALGDTLNAVGRALQKQQKLEDALKAYFQAVEVRRRLAELAPGVAEYRRTLANTLMNIGLAEMERGAASARDYMEQAQAIREQLLAAGCSDPKLRRDLAMGHFNLLKLAAQNRQMESAEASLKKARTLFEELRHADPNDLNARYQLAVCLRLEADLLCERLQKAERTAATLSGKQREEARRHSVQEREEALALYGKARAEMEALAEGNPSVSEYRFALARIHVNLALTEREQGRLEAAGASFDRAWTLLRALVAECAGNPRYRRELAQMAEALEQYHPQAARRAEAHAMRLKLLGP